MTVGVMSPEPQPPCLAVYAAEFKALDVAGTGRLPAEALVELLSSDKWDLTDVEVSGGSPSKAYGKADRHCTLVHELSKLPPSDKWDLTLRGVGGCWGLVV